MECGETKEVQFYPCANISPVQKMKMASVCKTPKSGEKKKKKKRPQCLHIYPNYDCNVKRIAIMVILPLCLSSFVSYTLALSTTKNGEDFGKCLNVKGCIYARMTNYVYVYVYCNVFITIQNKSILYN